MHNDPRMSKPYIRLGHTSDKGFNTTTTKAKSQCGSKCLSIGAFKASVNVARINRERMRVKLAKASFISVPRLVKVS